MYPSLRTIRSGRPSILAPGQKTEHGSAQIQPTTAYKTQAEYGSQRTLTTASGLTGSTQESAYTRSSDTTGTTTTSRTSGSSSGRYSSHNSGQYSLGGRGEAVPSERFVQPTYISPSAPPPKYSDAVVSCECGPAFYSSVLGPTGDEALLGGLRGILNVFKNFMVCQEQPQVEQAKELPKIVSSILESIGFPTEMANKIAQTSFVTIQEERPVLATKMLQTSTPEMVSKILQTLGMSPEMADHLVQTSFEELVPEPPSMFTRGLQTSDIEVTSEAMQTSQQGSLHSLAIQTSYVKIVDPEPVKEEPPEEKKEGKKEETGVCRCCSCCPCKCLQVCCNKVEKCCTKKENTESCCSGCCNYGACRPKSKCCGPVVCCDKRYTCQDREVNCCAKPKTYYCPDPDYGCGPQTSRKRSSSMSLKESIAGPPPIECFCPREFYVPTPVLGTYLVLQGGDSTSIVDHTRSCVFYTSTGVEREAE